MPETAHYLVATLENTMLVAIHGRATYLTCREFGEFLEKIGKADTKKLVIDMKNCSGADSTVFGLIAGAAGDFKGKGGEVILQRCNERTGEVAKNLGLPALLTLLSGDETAAGTEDALAAGTISQASAPATNHTILQAHETLMAANPENVARFREVVDFMRSDLGL